MNPLSFTVVVDKETVAGLAIETGKTRDSGVVFRILDNKAVVCGESLVALSRATGGSKAAIRVMKLGANADGTLADLVGDREVWDANGILVLIGTTVGVHMAETLMPKNPKLGLGKSMNGDSTSTWRGLFGGRSGTRGTTCRR